MADGKGKGSEGHRTAAHEDAPTISRAEVVAQLEAAGLFDRHIIGAEPENLTDAQLADVVEELGRQTIAAELSGKSVRDARDADTKAAVDAAEEQTLKDLGIDPSKLTGPAALLVREELRDPTSAPNPLLDSLLTDARDGTNTSGCSNRDATERHQHRRDRRQGRSCLGGRRQRRGRRQWWSDRRPRPRSAAAHRHGHTIRWLGFRWRGAEGRWRRGRLPRAHDGHGTDGSVTERDGTFHRDGEGHWTDENGNPVPADTAARLERERDSGDLQKQDPPADDHKSDPPPEEHKDDPPPADEHKDDPPPADDHKSDPPPADDHKAAGGGAEEQKGDPSDPSGPDGGSTENIDKLGGPLVTPTVHPHFGPTDGGATDPTDDDPNNQFGAGVATTAVPDAHHQLLGGDTFGADVTPAHPTGPLPTQHDPGNIDPGPDSDSSPQFSGHRNAPSRSRRRAVCRVTWRAADLVV